MPKKSAPEAVPLPAFSMPQFNVAIKINEPDPDIASKQPVYNATPDDGLASLRSKHMVRTHAEAAPSGDLPLGFGLSLRAAMPGQGENNQFPIRANQYGKQRA